MVFGLFGKSKRSVENSHFLTHINKSLEHVLNKQACAASNTSIITQSIKIDNTSIIDTCLGIYDPTACSALFARLEDINFTQDSKNYGNCEFHTSMHIDFEQQLVERINQLAKQEKDSVIAGIQTLATVMGASFDDSTTNIDEQDIKFISDKLFESKNIKTLNTEFKADQRIKIKGSAILDGIFFTQKQISALKILTEGDTDYMRRVIAQANVNQDAEMEDESLGDQLSSIIDSVIGPMKYLSFGISACVCLVIVLGLVSLLFLRNKGQA